jgi:hypothetical protein
VREALEAVPVPDYFRGEKGARIAKSDATSTLAYLDLALDRFATVLQTQQRAKLDRSIDEMERFLLEAEKKRRITARRLGCTKRLEDC